jgi:hypothetical protein
MGVWISDSQHAMSAGPALIDFRHPVVGLPQRMIRIATARPMAKRNVLEISPGQVPSLRAEAQINRVAFLVERRIEIVFAKAPGEFLAGKLSGPLAFSDCRHGKRP